MNIPPTRTDVLSVFVGLRPPGQVRGGVIHRRTVPRSHHPGLRLRPGLRGGGQVDHLIGTLAALDFLHRPPRGTDPALLNMHRNPARMRLAFEELLAQQLGLARVRCNLKRNPAPILSAGREVLRPFLDSLPFALTGAQSRIIEEIRNDLASSGPMLRLIQGDVGKITATRTDSMA